jgi:RNA-directed DNA polymerase
MIKASIRLQDLRKRLYTKAKAESQWRFWGLYVHVCKMETLREAYAMSKANDGAPGVDGVTFKDIERLGVDTFLQPIRTELQERRYAPMPSRRQEIPKGNGKPRILSADSDFYPDTVPINVRTVFRLISGHHSD